MCGIAGFIHSSGKDYSQDIIDRMLYKLHHRGPDDRGSWTHKNICLGYTRLSILDPSDRGNQPFITSDGQGILCYNGEVYNYRELREELLKEGVEFTSNCDTEVVLYALHKWGPQEAVRKFNGMFAFAYYNLQTETLWLGRDRAGIKPLYISRFNGVIAFASEMKALFEHPAVECRPDMHSITTYLLEKRLDGWTPFENVEELEPGSLLQISKEAEKEYTYFDLERDLDVNRILNGEKISFDDWLNDFEDLFSKCVQSHMISDVPVAAMCSGGVDSSLIAHFAHQYHSNLIAYVADVEGVSISEKDRATQVCDHLNIELRTVPVTRDDYLRFWPKAAYHREEPIFFKQSMLHFAVSEAVSRDGFKVLLCGEGADELFCGYHWQASIYEMWKIRRKRSKIFPNNRFIRFLMNLLPSHHPLNLDQLSGEPFQYLGNESPIGQLKPRKITSVDGGRRVLRRRRLMKLLEPLEKIEDRAFLARSFEDFIVHLGTSLKCNDKMNMANSVESRVPFLDKRLIDFALHLPVKTKYRNGISKPLLKTSASAHLPKDLMYQKKVGFHASDAMWNHTLHFLEDGWIEEKLKWSRKDKTEIKEEVQKDSQLQFQLVCTEIWAQLFFGHESPDKITEKLISPN